MVTDNKIPDGYKQTEVGVIPVDWMSSGLRISNSLRLEYGKGLPEKVRDLRGTVPVYGSNGIVGYHSTSLINVPCLVVGRKGSIGKVHFSKVPCWPIDTTYYALPYPGINIQFLYYFLSVLDLSSLDKSSAVPGLNRNDVYNLSSYIPPLPEQTAIANVLSDVDSLITSLDKVIAKKKDIKQGAMQELLTGKKRLPGFSGEWQVKRLGDISKVSTGSTPPTYDKSNYGGEYLFVSPADLGKDKYILDTEKKLSAKGFNFSRKFPKDSILFTCIGSTIGKSGMASIELTSNQQINAIFPDSRFSSDFLFYSLNLIAPKIKSSASEQAVPIINKSNFESTTVPLPLEIAEQSAIAQIPSDMDKEINQLEQKRDKYKDLKQAMMQQLLTGKIRLV